MKIFFYFSLLIVAGCLPSNPTVQTGGIGSGRPYVPHPYIPGGPTIDPLIPTYSSRNFDQMIKIFSKATGVHPSRSDIRDAIQKVRSQLPLSYNPVSYNTFSHISLTSLAIQFCSSFVDDNSDASGTNVLGIPQSDPAWADKVALALVNRFAISEVSEDPFLPLALTEMVSVMKETNGIVGTQYTYKKQVSMGCTVFLASSYFSFD